MLRYLRIIYDLLQDDGVWINIGPLLWHFENATTTSSKGEGSIELSLDEVQDLAREVGFVISVCPHPEIPCSAGRLAEPGLIGRKDGPEQLYRDSR